MSAAYENYCKEKCIEPWNTVSEILQQSTRTEGCLKSYEPVHEVLRANGCETEFVRLLKNSENLHNQVPTTTTTVTLRSDGVMCDSLEPNDVPSSQLTPPGVHLDAELEAITPKSSTDPTSRPPTNPAPIGRQISSPVRSGNSYRNSHAHADSVLFCFDGYNFSHLDHFIALLVGIQARASEVFSLSLRHTSLTTPHIQLLSEHIGSGVRFPRLTHLDLSGNPRIDLQSARYLMSLVRSVPTLKTLNLRECSVPPDISRVIDRSLDVNARARMTLLKTMAPSLPLRPSSGIRPHRNGAGPSHDVEDLARLRARNLELKECVLFWEDRTQVNDSSFMEKIRAARQEQRLRHATAREHLGTYCTDSAPQPYQDLFNGDFKLQNSLECLQEREVHYTDPRVLHDPIVSRILKQPPSVTRVSRLRTEETTIQLLRDLQSFIEDERLTIGTIMDRVQHYNTTLAHLRVLLKDDQLMCDRARDSSHVPEAERATEAFLSHSEEIMRVHLNRLRELDAKEQVDARLREVTHCFDRARLALEDLHSVDETVMRECRADLKQLEQLLNEEGHKRIMRAADHECKLKQHFRDIEEIETQQSDAWEELLRTALRLKDLGESRHAMVRAVIKEQDAFLTQEGIALGMQQQGRVLVERLCVLQEGIQAGLTFETMGLQHCTEQFEDVCARMDAIMLATREHMILEQLSYGEVFQNYYLTLGAMLYGMRKQREDLDRMMRNINYQMDVRLDTFDGEHEKYLHMYQEMVRRRDALDAKILSLEQRGDEQYDLFAPSEKDLLQEVPNVDFTPPSVLLEEQNVCLGERVLRKRRDHLTVDQEKLVSFEEELKHSHAITEQVRKAGLIKAPLNKPLRSCSITTTPQKNEMRPIPSTAPQASSDAVENRTLGEIPICSGNVPPRPASHSFPVPPRPASHSFPVPHPPFQSGPC